MLKELKWLLVINHMVKCWSIHSVITINNGQLVYAIVAMMLVNVSDFNSIFVYSFLIHEF